MAAPFSPIMIVVALVFAPTQRGMTEASMIRTLLTPQTRNRGSTTALSQTEIEEMEALSPKSEAERQQESLEERFLRGEPIPEDSSKGHHH